MALDRRLPEFCLYHGSLVPRSRVLYSTVPDVESKFSGSPGDSPVRIKRGMSSEEIPCFVGK